MTTRIADDWDRAAALVGAADLDFRASPTATIRAWARTVGADTGRMWPKIKRELLKQHGVDYDALRRGEGADAIAAVRAAADRPGVPTVVLYVAADDLAGTFAVTAGTLDTAWFGNFPRHDLIYRAGDQDSADESAAGKALFLTGRVREHLGVDVLRLRLRVCTPAVNRPQLSSLAAVNYRLLLDTVDVVETNPAIEMCARPGHRSWREIVLPTLVTADEVRS